jgi:molybdopterin-synthase adenylyltransferase
MKGRYFYQETFPGIGPKGQERLSRSRVLIVGCGALGSALATLAARAGVGFIRLVDSDSPELHNLHRQILFSERDVGSGLSKVALARDRLQEVNSAVEVEAVVARVEPYNILDLVQGVHLILDGTDNLPSRYLINEASAKTGVPWIHGGAVGARGNVMVFIPGVTPCFQCIFPEPGIAMDIPSCQTAGILGPTAFAVASVQIAEAMKLLVENRGSLLPGMLTLDLWENSFRIVDLREARQPDCPTCQQNIFRHLCV